MAERKYSLKELNYIAEKLIANKQIDHIDSGMVASVLPDEHKHEAEAVFQAMKDDGIIDKTTEGIAHSQHSSIKISYFNENPDLTPEQRAEAEKTAVEAIRSGDFSKINNNEYFIIDDGFKLSYEGGKTVLSPVNGENFITSGFENIHGIISQSTDRIDVFDLKASHNNEQIEGSLGIVRKDLPVSAIGSLSEKDIDAMTDIFGQSNSIPTSGYVIFTLGNNERPDEAIQRLYIPDAIGEKDAVLKDGVLYTINNVDGNIVANAIQYDKNAQLLEEICGYQVKKEEIERNIADEVLADEDELFADEEVHQNPAREPAKKQEPVANQPTVNVRDAQDIRPEDKAIDAQTVKVSNSPYFGNGEMKTYTGQDKTSYSNFYTRSLNSNESVRIATEIKINQLYNERARMKQMQKANDKGLFGLFKKLLRLTRNIVYALAKPLVKDIPIFAYNKEMDYLKKQINDAKTQYYLIEDNNKKFIKRYGLDVEEHDMTDAQREEWDKKHPQAQESDLVVDMGNNKTAEEYQAEVGKNESVKVSQAPETQTKKENQPQPEKRKEPVLKEAKPVVPNKPIPQMQFTSHPTEQDTLKMASSPQMDISMQTEVNKQTNERRTIVTLNREKADGDIEEIKLDYNPMKRELTNLTDAELSTEDIEDIKERILVAQQIAKGAKGTAGISEESWNKQDGKKPSKAMDAEKIASGAMKQKAFYVNGIKVDVKANPENDSVELSALGGKMIFARAQFGENPRELINMAAHNLAINKQICYMCDKLPDMLTGSKLYKGSSYFKNFTENKVSFQQPEIKPWGNGRPFVTIPAYLGQEGEKPLTAVITIDTNSGSINWKSSEIDKFNPDEIKKMNHIMEIVKGKYAKEMLSFAPSDVVYDASYSMLVENALKQEVKTLSPAEKEKDFILSGAKVHLERADSGTIKIHLEDSKGFYPQEYTLYGGQGDFEMLAEKIQEIGRISLIQDRNDFVKADIIHDNERLQVNEMTMRYGDARHGDGRAPVQGPNESAIDNEIPDYDYEK